MKWLRKEANYIARRELMGQVSDALLQ